MRLGIWIGLWFLIVSLYFFLGSLVIQLNMGDVKLFYDNIKFGGGLVIVGIFIMIGSILLEDEEDE